MRCTAGCADRGGDGESGGDGRVVDAGGEGGREGVVAAGECAGRDEGWGCAFAAAGEGARAMIAAVVKIPWHLPADVLGTSIVKHRGRTVRCTQQDVLKFRKREQDLYFGCLSNTYASATIDDQQYDSPKATLKNIVYGTLHQKIKHRLCVQ